MIEVAVEVADGVADGPAVAVEVLTKRKKTRDEVALVSTTVKAADPVFG